MLNRLVAATLLSVVVASVHADAARAVTLDVKGMDCAACPVTVKAILKKQPGVNDVKVDLKTATAEVTFDQAKVSPEKLAQAVTQAGFPSTVRK